MKIAILALGCWGSSGVFCGWHLPGAWLNALCSPPMIVPWERSLIVVRILDDKEA